MNTSANPKSAYIEPMVHVPAIKLRQSDGSLLIKAGRPEVLPDEVSVTEFHRETGISKRHIATLCEQGLIHHRRLSPKRDSKILIPRSEVVRYLALDDEASERATMPAGKFNGASAPASSKNVACPPAKRGGVYLASTSNT